MLSPPSKSDRSGPCAFETPGEALTSLLERLAPVGTEEVPLIDAAGRVLAESIVADQPHPASDVSAMDGYALRVADASGKVPVCGEVDTGHAPPALPAHCAMRIFTGGVLPEQGETVIPREQVVEASDHIVVPEGLRVSPGQNIRCRGENANRGDVVVRAGSVMHPARIAAAATFGVGRGRVYRAVGVGVMITGNEVVSRGEAAPSQVMDANGPALASLLARVPYVSVVGIEHVADDPQQTRDVLASLVERCNVVLITGGVSKGDHDYVPAAVSSVATVVFHGLPIRPGRPILAAVREDNKLILGLPGNPLSVMIAARRIGLEAIRKQAGAESSWCVPAVRLEGHDGRTLGLWWYRPVVKTGDGTARLVPSKGSADLVSGAASDGFIELAPQAAGPGPWPFYPWGEEG